jgi:hypothetical protein
MDPKGGQSAKGLQPIGAGCFGTNQLGSRQIPNIAKGTFLNFLFSRHK